MHSRNAFVAALLLLTCVSGQSNLCDRKSWIISIDKSCATNDITIGQQLVLNASTCLSTLNFRQNLRVFTTEAFLNKSLQPRVTSSQEEYSSSTVVLVVNGSIGAINASEELNRDILSYYDGYVVAEEMLPEFAQLGVVAPMDRAIITEPELNWFRINRFYRGFLAAHLARVYGVPLGGAGVFTYYRQDLFRDYNLTIPRTWEGLLATALAWKAAQPVPGISPFCTSRRSYCASMLLLSIAAPYMQALGTRDGFLIDPANGTLLLNSTGFTAALRMWQQLSSFSGSDANASCGWGSDMFAEGNCLMTVQPFQKFKIYAVNTSIVSNKLGVALPPGSAFVMNRSTGRMEPCTAASCPHASNVQVQQQQGGSGDSASGGGGNSTVLVNSAPFMWGGFVGMVNARNPSWVQLKVIRYFADIASNSSLENVLRRGSRISPFRADHWSVAAMRNWTDAGYTLDAVKQMLEVLPLLHASPNLAPQLRLPGQADVSYALAAALANLTAGRSPEEVAAALQAEVAATLLARYGMVNGTYGFLSLYRQQLGYADSSSSNAEMAPRNSSASGVSRQTVVVIAVVIGLVLVLAALVAWEVRNKRRHKDLLGRVKPPVGDPDTTIVVVAIQDFDDLWEALLSDASERALQQFSDLVDSLLCRHSGYRAPAEEEEDVVVAFHCPRDACEFSMELQRDLLQLRWPKNVLEMEQFRPQYLAQTKRAGSFNQSYKGARAPMSPLTASMPTEDDEKLFTLSTGAENVRSFGEQCVASWTAADAAMHDAELVFCGIRARVGLCAVGYSHLALELGLDHQRFSFVGEAVEVAAAAAAAAQGGMVLIPQSTFRQLHLEVQAEQCLFCHLGEYQLTAELPPMDLYLALDRQLLGRLALFRQLTCHMQWSQGAFAAPVHSASMVFTHVVGVQTLLAWDYDLMQDVIETFTRLAQVELQQAGGYLVEHVEGFMLTAFHSPADAILWGLRMQELMLKEDWPEELLAHELCEEVTVTVPVRGGEVTSATVFRGPRLKTGIDIGQVLARLHTMTGRMTYRGKVMNRAARISAAASSGQVLCSSEAWESCTASASALRLVTAASLGLFQLKGIQERIEVFHCTYQRNVPSSTRRSSTVSVGIASSDNRRKSALVLSSMSHASQHTSYRTSMHNSVALENVSTSDVNGGRRGSQASSSTALVGRASFGGGQLSDMLSVGPDPDRANAVATSSSRYRSAFVPVLVGGGGADGTPAAAAHTSQTGSSHRSQCSGTSCGGGGAGGSAAAAGGSNAAGVLTFRAMMAAVLQSRTRSASAIQASSNVSPLRSASARTRRPAGLSCGAVSSESQVSLATGGAAPQRLSSTMAKWTAATATSPSAMPSLAMTAAVAAAAAQERSASINVNGTCSPKATALLEAPCGVPGLGDNAATQSTFAALSGISGIGGVYAESAATGNSAVYAVLPSVVLSGAVMGGVHAPPAAAGSAHGQGGMCSAFMAPVLDDNEELIEGGGGGIASPVELQMVATIATCVGDVLLDGRCYSSSGAAGESFHSAMRPQQQQRGEQHQSSSPSPPFQFERIATLETLNEDSPPAEDLCAGRATGASVTGDGIGMLDDASRVETLEVTVSATGIARGALSGAPSSTGFGAAFGSSQGASISRCGSATAGMSYLAMGISGGLASSPGGTVVGGTGGPGSQESSCTSSGLGHHSYTQGRVASAARPLSAAVWRAPMCMSSAPQGLLHGLAGPGVAVGRHSGSASSADLYLPFPMGGGCGYSGGGTSSPAGGDAESAGGGGGGGGSGGTTRSLNGCMTAAAGGGLGAHEVSMGSDGTVFAADSQQHQNPSSDGLVVGVQSTATMHLPHRNLVVARNGRLAAVADAVHTGSAAAVEGTGARPSPRSGSTSGCDHQSIGRAPLPTEAAVTTPMLAAIDASTPSVAAAALPLDADTAATSAADAATVPDFQHVRGVTVDARGSDHVSSSLVVSAESRSNSSHTAADAAATAAALSSATAMNMASTVGGRDGSSSGDVGGRLSSVGGIARRGSGSSSGGRLRPNNGTASGASNDPTSSQAVSPFSTWASGYSGTSTNTNTTTNTATATTMPGSILMSPTVTSGAASEQLSRPRRLAKLPQQYHQQHPVGARSLRALLEGVVFGIDTGAGSVGGTPACAPLQHTSDYDAREVEAAPTAEPKGKFPELHPLRAVGVPTGGAGSCSAGGGGNDGTAATAAAFGITPPAPCTDYGGPAASAAAVAAAAAFGIGPPLDSYISDDVASVGGPTRKQLELALELLGESRHAAGGGWH